MDSLLDAEQAESWAGFMSGSISGGVETLSRIPDPDPDRLVIFAGLDLGGTHTGMFDHIKQKLPGNTKQNGPATS